MEYSKFFSLLAAFIGFVGALFLSKSVIMLTPKIMVQLTSPNARWDYAPEQIESMAAQKADAVVGIIFVLLAFAIHVFSIIFAPDSKKIFSSHWMSFWVVAAIVSIITIGFTLYKSRLNTRYQVATGKIAIQDYFNDRFRKVVDPVNVSSLETMSYDLLKIKYIILLHALYGDDLRLACLTCIYVQTCGIPESSAFNVPFGSWK